MEKEKTFMQDEEIEAILKALNHRIKDLYKEKDMSQTALAAAIGMEQSDLAGRLSDNNSKRLTLEGYIKIAKALDISLSELFDISPTQKRPSATLYPRDVCKMLADIYDSNYSFDIRSASDIKREIGIGALSEEDTWIVFRCPPTEESLPTYNHAEYKNLERRSINGFLQSLRRISDMRETDRYSGGGFDDEMYETMLGKYLDKVNDATQHAEGQLAFNKRMYQSGAEPFIMTDEAAGISDLKYQDHLAFLETMEGEAALDPASGNSGEAKSSKKKKREQD